MVRDLPQVESKSLPPATRAVRIFWVLYLIVPSYLTASIPVCCRGILAIVVAFL